MDENLRLLFDRALADEPGPPPDDLADRAKAAGAGLRRRRHRLVGAAVATVTAVAALGVATVGAPPDAPPETVPAGFAMLLNPACTSPARDTATDVSVFLTPDITDQQRAALDRALETDPAVQTHRYESREAAHAHLARMFADAPQLVDAVKASDLPASFRVKLSGPYADFVDRVGAMPGIDQIIGHACPKGTDIWTTG